MVTKQDLPVVSFPSREAWAAWLEGHYDAAPGVWLKIAKKGAGVASVTYAEAVDAALCFGWIDSQKAAFDEAFSLQRFTPRRAKSPWSRVNRDKAEALIAAGEMRPSGLREVERAKADGRWETAYEPQSTATVPDDLRRALDANEAASAFFATLNSVNRYAILHRVHAAKKPETRARRIEQFVAMLAEGKKLYP